ncbi:iron chelate uptake ABC transporter family permease subunit [Klebsiella quasipneumoniae]|uniref:iron chelate uptake ABC transporter family permease subunit n=1 Tax=Klebsiella quasipneumoniae TaxID=1463165 RepID=UPI001D11D20C
MRWLLLLIAFPLLSHAAVERLVTLGGDVTEIVYALGAQQSLVARDSTSSWPPAAQKLPDVGYLRQLNAEGILALRPQLVLASAQAQPSLVLHKVQASGVKVVNVPGGENPAAIDKKVAVIAEALGKTPAGDALRQQLQQQIAAIPTQPIARRVLLALLVGAALALSGCVMQGLFRNPLADPGLLGISSGAALAVACLLVLPLSASGLIALYMPMLAAFIGSLAVMVVIFILSRAEEGSLSRLLLVGIAINALCGALVGVLAWLSNDAQLRQLSLWGMGSLGQAEWPTLLVATTLIIPAALAVWWMASHLNLLQLGDEEAHYLGVNVRALQRWLLLCSAVLVAAAVAISGVIGFIGLVVPHLMRLWLGPDHRGLVPGSLLAGAILLLLADTLARTVAAPAEMPVGLLTSLLGAPWFLWLVFRRENLKHG